VLSLQELIREQRRLQATDSVETLLATSVQPSLPDMDYVPPLVISDTSTCPGSTVSSISNGCVDDPQTMVRPSTRWTPCLRLPLDVMGYLRQANLNESASAIDQLVRTNQWSPPDTVTIPGPPFTPTVSGSDVVTLPPSVLPSSSSASLPSSSSASSSRPSISELSLGGGELRSRSSHSIQRTCPSFWTALSTAQRRLGGREMQCHVAQYKPRTGEWNTDLVVRVSTHSRRHIWHRLWRSWTGHSFSSCNGGIALSWILLSPTRFGLIVSVE
jgi:hypothetical protein